MKLTIATATEADLLRAEELTYRTHQLNSTGVVYTSQELQELLDDPDCEVLIVQMDDNYGSYGKIGLALIEKRDSMWVLTLLLLSCRVMARGVGRVLLSYLVNKAATNEVDLLARFVPNDKNQIMLMTYKFGGFYELDTSQYPEEDSVENQDPDQEYIMLKANIASRRVLPSYVTVDESSVSSI
jgi:FkbH-like protein